MATLFPQTNAAVGGYSLVTVASTTPPVIDQDTQNITEGTPVLTNGGVAISITNARDHNAYLEFSAYSATELVIPTP